MQRPLSSADNLGPILLIKCVLKACGSILKPWPKRSGRDQDFLNAEFETVTLEEEDRLVADRREFPRTRPHEKKWVKVMVLAQAKVHVLNLYDLSQG